MAMRQRSGGVPATIPRQPVYENFEPKSERKEEVGADLLLVHLYGFLKEQVGITFQESSRTLRLQGLRPLGNNRWSRFNQSYPVAEYCDIEKLHANFQHGILTITMPKQIIPQAQVVAPKPQKVQEDNIPQQPKPTTSTQKPPSPDKSKSKSPVREPKPEILDFPPKPTSSTAVAEKQKDEKRAQPKAQSPPKKATSDDKPRTDEIKTIAPAPSPTPQKAAASDEKSTEPIAKAKSVGDQKAIEKKETSDEQKPEETKEDNKVVERNMIKGKESSIEKGIESAILAVGAVPKFMDFIKEERISGGGKEEKKPQPNAGKRSSGVKNVMDSAKQTVQRLAKRVNDEEERQAMINVGAAILVIVALGAYISFTYASSGKSKN